MHDSFKTLKTHYPNYLTKDNKLMNNIASNLRFLRKLAGLSQEQFAKKVGMNRGNIASYEKGNAEPNIEKLQRIVKYFDVSLVAFIQSDLSKQINTNQLSRYYNAKDERKQQAEKLANQNASTGGLSNNLMPSINELLQHTRSMAEYETVIRHSLYKDVKCIAKYLQDLTKTIEDLVKVNQALLLHQQQNETIK